MLRKRKSFFKYKFIPFKNKYNDDIDQCDELIMDGTKPVVTEISTSITLSRGMKQVNLNRCTVFDLESLLNIPS